MLSGEGLKTDQVRGLEQGVARKLSEQRIQAERTRGELSLESANGAGREVEDCCAKTEDPGEDFEGVDVEKAELRQGGKGKREEGDRPEDGRDIRKLWAWLPQSLNGDGGLGDGGHS